MDLTTILNGAIGAGIFATIAKLIDLYNNRNKPKIDNAEAAEKLIGGGVQAVTVMRELLDDYDKRDEKKDAKIEKLEAWKAEREKLSYQRDIELLDQQQRYEDLEAAYIGMTNEYNKDLKETKELREVYKNLIDDIQKTRNDYAIAQKDNIRFYELTVGLAEAVVKIKKAVQDADITVPLNGELDRLMQSVYRLKAEREQRGEP
jgi:hypothetical protein